MWNKKEEGMPQKPVPVSPAPQAVAPQPREVIQPRAAEAQREPVRPAGSAASIGSSMIIVGEIYSREELMVDGEVDGKLELQHRLTVGPNGKVRATIKAREVVVFGNVQGDVEVSDKITIKKGGSLVGDIRTAGIVIDDGAYFKG